MSPIVRKALEAITARTNLSTGLAHPNDKNAAKELLSKLQAAGFGLDGAAVEAWAAANGWKASGAKELGAIAASLGAGRRVIVKDGPWWKPDILGILDGKP